MKKYIGMNYQKWCQLDEDDERRINYTLSGIMEGKRQTMKFTSEDYMDGLTLHRVQRSEIKNIQLIKNEWHIELKC